MTEGANADNEPWIAQFDKELRDWDKEPGEDAFAVMLKDFLLSDGDSAAAETAHRIDNFYTQEYLPSDPIMKFEADQGMEGFLGGLYENVFTLARLIPYNSSNQDKLVQVILELRKLPPRQFKIWQEYCLVWTREPIFAMLQEDNWNGNHPSDFNEENGGDGYYSFEELCHQWVNFSSFLARCVEAGVDDRFENRCKYPSIDIPEGLEHDLPRGPERDCKAMVAAQYILLAGRTLADDCFQKLGQGFGPDRWRHWAEKLGEISKQEGRDTCLGSATDKARRYMVSLHPELFIDSEDG